MFANLRDGEKNRKKQIPKKINKKRSKYVRTNGQMNERKNGPMDEQTDGRTNRRTDGRTDERTQKGVAKSASQITGSEHAEAGRGRFCR